MNILVATTPGLVSLLVRCEHDAIDKCICKLQEVTKRVAYAESFRDLLTCRLLSHAAIRLIICVCKAKHDTLLRTFSFKEPRLIHIDLIECNQECTAHTDVGLTTKLNRQQMQAKIHRTVSHIRYTALCQM